MQILAAPRRLWSGAAVALLLAACGGDSPSDPGTAQAPVINIVGVTEGTTYNAPVTINVTVDRGSYQATLDGAQFNSGTTVSVPGAHVLKVDARNGSATSSKEVRFTIGGSAGGALIIRLINLGANASGGGGDAIFITDSTAAGKKYALIDAGPGPGGDNNWVRTQLGLYGVTQLEFVQLTHAHSDHYAGLGAVLTAIPTKRFIWNGQVSSSTQYTSFINQVRNTPRADSIIQPRDQTPYALQLGAGNDAATFTVLPPLPDFIGRTTVADSSAWANEGSLGTEIRQGTFQMFMTGDGEFRANARWISLFPAYTSTLSVLKAGHHGSNDAVWDEGRSSTGRSSWITHTAPETVVISANGTTHPLQPALSWLQNGRRVFCTNVHGTITITVQRTGAYNVSVEKNPTQTCLAAQ